MTTESLVKLFQLAGAALAIPAAAAGTFAAYQSYFSTDVSCQKLRNDIVGIMERNVPPDTKRSLLKKDVTEFEKFCGDADPEARAIFQAAMSEHPADSTHAAASAHTDPPSPRAQIAALSVFGATGSKEHYGWVAISRRQSGSWVANFNGYAISETSLPPPGTILSAKIMLPVWSEPRGGANDQSKLQSRLPSGACVRVLSTRGGSGRLWAEVAPASCS
jgi:hypothetical protein